jgi:hypothetical protein
MALKKIEAIKTYFEADPHGRKVTMDEMKALTSDERQELAEMCAAALGDELAAA